MKRVIAACLLLVLLGSSAGANDKASGNDEKKTKLSLFDTTKSYFLSVMAFFNSGDSQPKTAIKHPKPLDDGDCGATRRCLACYIDLTTGQQYCPGDPGYDPCHDFHYPGPDVQQP